MLCLYPLSTTCYGSYLSKGEYEKKCLCLFRSQALLTENFITRDTIVQENGKVLPEVDESKYHIFFTDQSYIDKIPKNRELKIKKKLYEFYTAPITKFWANAVSS